MIARLITAGGIEVAMEMHLEAGVCLPARESVFRRALARNLLAQRFAIDAYRQIAAHSGNHGYASLRLANMALAVEEEQAQILSSIIQRFSGSDCTERL